MVQSISGISELVGTDVNLIHRLAKNNLKEETGWTAYAMFTESSLQQMDLTSDGMYALVESYNHLGDVSTFSTNLRDRYEEMLENREAYITEGQAHASFSYELDIPVPVAWDWLSNVQKRTLASEGATWSNINRVGGRTGAGTTNHCAHGKGEISVETILDWRPFEYFTADTQSINEKKSPFDMVSMHEFKSINNRQGTLLIYRVKLHKPNPLIKIMLKTMFRSGMNKYMAKIESLAKAEMNASLLKPNYQLMLEHLAAQNTGEDR